MKQSSSLGVQPLEDAISKSLLPALTRQSFPNASIRNMFALPAGLGIANPLSMLSRQQDASRAICKPLIQLILEQGGDTMNAKQQQHIVKCQLAKQRREDMKMEAES